MNELCKKIILTIFIFCLCYIILKNISTTNKIIEGKRGRRGRGRGRGRGRSFFKKIKIFKGRKKKNKKTSPRPPTLPTPPTPPPLLSKYPLLCSIDPKYKNRRTYKPNSKWTSIDDMNKAYGLTHITRNDLNNKLDINKIFHNYQGNNINVDYIYSFGKKDKINNNINENNILYAYWGYNGSNKFKDSFNKNGDYDCYQDVTKIVKENIKLSYYRSMIRMKNKFKDPLHGIEKRLFIKLKNDTQKYINDLKSLKSNIDNIVNSFDNEIKKILAIILKNGNSIILTYYKNKFDDINNEYNKIYTEIKKNFSSMKEFNIPTVVSYINKVNKRIYILNILRNNQFSRNFRSFYETVINKKRLENIQIYDEDYIFEGPLTFTESNSTIIDQLYNYRSDKELFKNIFVCKQFKKIKNPTVLKIHKYSIFNGNNYGLIDDDITKRLNIKKLAVLK